MNDIIGFVLAVFGLAAACGGIWALLVLRGRLDSQERNSILTLILVGAILILIGYVLSRPTG